ncbi:MAG: hypothetical protein UY85_C0039G0002 [Candidatus Peribacteria bacterium GW2011_GWB1_54_5]|nr:MAG: hypothetical protein UY85_C0039G0002 [Candidatus Peribacteria bacterium GW2011_GWB1_54_5]
MLYFHSIPSDVVTTILEKIIITMVLLVSFSPGVSLAQTETPTDSSSLLEQEYSILKEQTQSFVEFIKDEREALREQQAAVFTHVEWFIAIAALVICAVLGFFGWKTLGNIDKSVQKHLGPSIANAVKEQSENIKQQIERELQSLERKITVIADHDDIPTFKSRELSIMERRGFKNIVVSDSPEDKSIEQAELVVYWYRSDKEGMADDVFRALVNRLSSHPNQPPLIVYTFDKAPRIVGDDKVALDSYVFHFIANMPLTLINSIFSTLNAFYPTHK